MQPFFNQIKIPMPVKIRLARHGKKNYPFYHIVAADSRAPRDGKYIERIGSYNPNTNPATIELNFDKALGWIQNGAVPSDTCRTILSYRGVLYKNHLLKGVAKGALTQEQADEKYNTWREEKDAKIQAKVDKLSEEAKAEYDKRYNAESKIRETRAQELAKKNSNLAKMLGVETPKEEDVKTDEKQEAKDDSPKEAKTTEDAEKKDETKPEESPVEENKKPE